jgi:hypothetical protein
LKKLKNQKIEEMLSNFSSSLLNRSNSNSRNPLSSASGSSGGTLGGFFNNVMTRKGNEGN